MKITLLTYGSRGDVQPFLALAVGLQHAGHNVTFAAPHRFTDFIENYGIHCEQLAGDPDELSALFNDAGSNLIHMVRSMQQHVLNIAPDVVRGARNALQGADLLVHSFAFTTGGHSYARELGIPDISLQMFPVFAPTRAFPAIGTPATGIGWLNYFSHWFSTRVFWHGGNAGFYRLRRTAPEDFPAHLYWPFARTPNRPLTPLVFAVSPHVLPKSGDWNQPHIHLPGYLFLDEPDYQPPEELHRFLEADEPPLCITFGSMVNREAQRITHAVLTALRNTGNRAVFLSGWGGWRPDNPPPTALFLDSAPHSWLFPRCRSVVHHGGAGTTAAALRAGVPAIIVPHAADQPFWGNRIAAIGTGPAPIPVRKLTAETLTAALVQANSEAIRQRSAELGELIRAENGVAHTVALIEEHAATFRETMA